MKTLFTLMILISSFAFGQNKETEWETLNNGGKGFTLYYRFVKENDVFTLEAKLAIYKGVKQLPFTVSENKKIIFKLKDGNLVELLNNRYSETCVGCGAVGLTGSNALGAKMYYSLDKESIESLLSSNVESVKIYTDDDSYENIIKQKKYEEFNLRLTEIYN